MPKDFLELKHSQNFLRSPELVTKLVKAKTQFSKSDNVVDIGTGNGAIAMSLAKMVGEVWTYEIDEKRFRELETLVAGSNVKLFKLNFLQTDLSKRGPYKVFSNIPFFLTAEIVRKLFLDSDNAPQEAYIFMQREAAVRFMGLPLQKDTLLAILLKTFWEIKIVHTFSFADFDPIPNVDVVLVSFQPLKNPKVEWNKRTKFFDFVSFLLNLRKPKLKNALLELFSFNQLQIISRNLKLNLQAPPSTLATKDWQEMFLVYIKYVDQLKQGACKGAYAHLLQHQVKLNQFRNNIKQ